jgi:hypothetical protein
MACPSSWKMTLRATLVSVRKVVESYESVVIQGWWPDSMGSPDVD